MKKMTKNGQLAFLLAVLIMGILFYSSSQTYEQQSQIGLLSKLLHNEPLKDSLRSISFMYGGSEVSIDSEGYFSFIEFFIRKFAHFSTYFVLSGSFFFSLFQRKNALWLSVFFGWMAATGYAGMDEFHQMLTSGRSPLFQDVMLDSAGALTAGILCWFVIGLRHKRWV